ncbi:MAG: hypothetical protein KJ709_06895 [Nanoarchaeota archaeon]|nr:hypothetical protein [Nanoarchaeota archaeon]
MKKGQFYIFTAFVLIGAVAALIPRQVDIKPPRTILNDVADNYKAEAPRVINTAIWNGTNLTPVFRQFTTEFMGYVQDRDTSIGMAYAFVDTETHVGNHFSADIRLGDGSTITSGGFLTVPKNDSLIMEVYGRNYTFDTSQAYSYSAVFRVQKGQNVEVKIVR